MGFMLISNIVSLIIFLGVYMYIYKNYPTLIFVFFYLFFGYLSMVVSVFYLDFGGKYSFELSKTSVQSNSLVILTLFYLSTILENIKRIISPTQSIYFILKLFLFSLFVILY